MGCHVLGGRRISEESYAQFEAMLERAMSGSEGSQPRALIRGKNTVRSCFQITEKILHAVAVATSLYIMQLIMWMDWDQAAAAVGETQRRRVIMELMESTLFSETPSKSFSLDLGLDQIRPAEQNPAEEVRSLTCAGGLALS